MDTNELGKDVRLSKYVLAVILFTAIGAYTYRFWGQPPGGPDAWGQFGDYLGGLMNPLIAFGAFYWLATSVLLQKTELAETRAALVNSHKAQQQHADTVLATARLQTLNIRLSLAVNTRERLLAQHTTIMPILREWGPEKTIFDGSGVNRTIGDQLQEILTEMTLAKEAEQVLINQIHNIERRFINFELASLGL
ncbi:MAG: hypothetical protein WKG03_02900 [Telluria sp.]